MSAKFKFIKVDSDIFVDEKILLIEQLPEADSIISIWFKLLCFAGKQENNGIFLLRENVPYTEEMLATIFHRDISIIHLAIDTFNSLGMIDVVNGLIKIPNWKKYQVSTSYENKKEYDRLYRAKKREKESQKANESDTNKKVVRQSYDYYQKVVRLIEEEKEKLSPSLYNKEETKVAENSNFQNISQNNENEVVEQPFEQETLNNISIEVLNNSLSSLDIIKDSKEKREDISCNKKIIQKEYLDMFNLFWEAYPKKQAKKNCQKWFQTHKPKKETFQKILRAVEKQKETDQWKEAGGKYIPMPSTWLNQERWNDELDTTKEVTKTYNNDFDNML